MWTGLMHSIRGRVIDAASGRPLAGLHVRAYDRRLIWDDCLGCADTEADGGFRIALTGGSEPEDPAEIYVVVYGPQLHQLHFTEPVHVTGGLAAELRIALHTGVPARTAPRQQSYAA